LITLGSTPSAYVVKGLVGQAFLRNHSTERVGAARDIIEEAGKSTRSRPALPTACHRRTCDWA
jgi:hypothetical protein